MLDITIRIKVEIIIKLIIINQNNIAASCFFFNLNLMRSNSFRELDSYIIMITFF
jgi:hypothetical protein